MTIGAASGPAPRHRLPAPGSAPALRHRSRIFPSENRDREGSGRRPLHGPQATMGSFPALTHMICSGSLRASLGTTQESSAVICNVMPCSNGRVGVRIWEAGHAASSPGEAGTHQGVHHALEAQGHQTGTDSVVGCVRNGRSADDDDGPAGDQPAGAGVLPKRSKCTGRDPGHGHRRRTVGRQEEGGQRRDRGHRLPHPSQGSHHPGPGHRDQP